MNIDELNKYLWCEPFGGSLFFKEKGKLKLATKDNHSCGYSSVYLNGKPYLAHRVIYYMSTGEYPKGDIDHINGNKRDNRIINLRLVSRSLNNMNKHSDPISTTGYRGVTLTPSNTYYTRIKKDGKQICLGTYKTAQESAYARDVAAMLLFGDYATLNNTESLLNKITRKRTKLKVKDILKKKGYISEI